MGRTGRTPGVDPSVITSVWRHLRARDQRPRPKLPDGTGVHVVRAADDTAELRLYDEIGFWGITAADFVQELGEIDAKAISLRINSPGGDVFDGIAIYNALRDHPATIDVTIDGLAASAASFIAQAGDQVVMNRASQMMIHDALGFTIGNAADHRETAGLLDRISDTIAGIYADRAGEDVAFWRERMLAETWYTAAEAVQAGLADSQVAKPEPDGDQGEGEPAESQAAARFDLASTRFLYAGRAQAPPPVLTPPADRPDLAAVAAAALEGAF